MCVIIAFKVAEKREYIIIIYACARARVYKKLVPTRAKRTDKIAKKYAKKNNHEKISSVRNARGGYIAPRRTRTTYKILLCVCLAGARASVRVPKRVCRCVRVHTGIVVVWRCPRIMYIAK